jgi:hypothetical protein
MPVSPGSEIAGSARMAMENDALYWPVKETTELSVVVGLAYHAADVNGEYLISPTSPTFVNPSVSLSTV